nr:Gag-Pol polyprotein [Tanacetum cinerariifolium]
PSTHTNVHAKENNNDQAKEGEQLQDVFVHRHKNKLNHPLEQVRGNPSRLVQTRRQLATYPEMCMHVLTVSTAEPKNINEAMADSAWIEAMQEELHQFDRLQASDYDNPDLVPQQQDVSSSADADVPSQQELDILFGPLYDEFFNAGYTHSTNIQSTSAPSTHTNVHAKENNNDQAKEGEQLQDVFVHRHKNKLSLPHTTL